MSLVRTTTLCICGLVLAATHASASELPDAVRYETVYEFDVVTEFEGRTTRSKRGIDDFLWRGDAESRRTPPRGFKRYGRSFGRETYTWNGAEVRGKEVMWRPMDENRALGFSTTSIKRSDAVPTPAFVLPRMSAPAIPVPAGTIEFVGRPERRHENPLDIRYGFVETTTHTLGGDNSFATYRFDFEAVANRGGERESKITGELVTGHAVLPPAIWSFRIEETGVVDSAISMTITDMTTLTPDPRTKAFAKYGFGVSPPPGFEFATPGKGEVVQFVDEDRNISVRAFARDDQQTFEDWVSEQKATSRTPLVTARRTSWHGRDGMENAGYREHEFWFPVPKYVVHVRFDHEPSPAELAALRRCWRWTRSP